MSRLIYTFPILALVGMASPVFAQDDTAEAPATTETEAQIDQSSDAGSPDAAEETAEETTDGTEEQSGGIAAELDMGTDPDADADPTYVKAVYDDWELKCFRSEAENDPCQMYQLLYEAGGSPVAEFSIFRLPGESQATAGATVIVPLGTLLTEDINISVDDGKAKSYSYRFCNLVGCYAQIGLTQADVDAFRRGVQANLRIVPAQAPDQVVDIPVSLKGFTAAFENTTVLDQ